MKQEKPTKQIRKKSFLRYIFRAALIVLLLLSIAALAFSRLKCDIPQSFLDKIYNTVRKNYELDIKVESGKINVPDSTFEIRSLSFGVSDEPSLLELGSAKIIFSPDSGLMDLINNKAVADSITLNNATIDLKAPMKSSASSDFAIPYIPFRQIILEGLNLKTPYGDFDLSNYKVSLLKKEDTAELTMKIEQGPYGISASLDAIIDLKTNVASATVFFRQEKLQEILPLKAFLESQNIALSKGAAFATLKYDGDLVKRINDFKSDWIGFFEKELFADIRLENLEASFAGIPFTTHFKALHELDSDWILSGESCLLNGITKIDGCWKQPGKSDSFLDVNMKLSGLSPSQADLERLAEDLQDIRPGKINGDLKIIGDIQKPEIKGDLIFSDWRWKENLAKSLSFDLNFKPDAHFTASALGLTDIGTFNADLSGTPKGWDIPIIDFSLGTSDIRAEKVTGMPELGVSGLVTAMLSGQIDTAVFENSEYKGKVEVLDGAYQTFNPEKASFLISGSGKTWKLTDPQVLFSDGGKITASGEITPDGYNLKAELNKINLNNLLVPADLANGFVNVKADIQGELLNPEVKASIWTEKVRVKDYDISSVRASAKLKDSILEVNPAVISMPGNTVIDGYLVFDIKKGVPEAFRLSWQGLNLPFLNVFMPSPFSNIFKDGILRGTLKYAIKENRHTSSFNLEGYKLDIDDNKIDTLYLEGKSSDLNIEIQNFFVRAFEGSLNMNADINGKENITVFLSGENLHLDKIAFLRKILPDLEGTLNFQGNVNVDEHDKFGEFTIFAKDLQTDERELGNFGGNVHMDREKLTIRQGEFDKLGIKIAGDMFWSDNRPYKAKITFDEADFSFIPIAHDLDIVDSGGLLVDGDCEISGELSNGGLPYLAEANFTKFKMQKQGEIIENLKPISLVYQNGAVELRQLELGYKEGKLMANGIITPKGDMTFMIQGDQFSAKALGSLVLPPSTPKYDGTINMSVRILGNLKDPKLHFKAALSDFVIENKKIPSVDASAVINKSGIEILDTAVTLFHNSFNLKGNVYFKEGGFIPETMDLNLFIPEGPIADLKEYLPGVVKDAAGIIKADLNITGLITEPKITGDLNIDSKKVSLQMLQKPLTNIALSLSTSDRIINIDAMQASLGRGGITGRGKIDFKDGLGILDVQVEANKLDIPMKDIDIRGVMAKASLKGDLYNPEIKAKVTIPRANINLSKNLIPKTSKSEPIFKTMKYDIKVDVPKNFRVKSSFLQAELQGDLAVVGDLDNFSVSGAVRTLKGDLFFQRRRFKIKEGELHFGGIDNSFDPYMSIKSEGQIQNTKVFLTVTGNISSFTPNIYSSPPMSEADLIGLLAFGHGLDTTNKDSNAFENEIMEGLKNSYLSSLLGAPVSEALNLDELYLTSMSDRGGSAPKTFLRVGKYITDKFFVAYEGTMSDDDRDENYIFEYRLPKGFIFSVEFKEPESERSFGIKYDWRF